ncbi:MAG: FumA C-terminus/TtdB family hydratase beta subunit [Armatimonadia bacterium]
MEAVKLTTPLDDEAVRGLRAGQQVLLSGVVYTARDAAHQRIVQALDAGEQPPFALGGQVIYYCGPAPTPPGRALGSAGPTSSYRMDPYTPLLYSRGLKATIGKGNRDEAVRWACVEHTCLYLVAVGGAGAVLADCVIEAEVIAYPELGPEAVRRLVVADLPLIVAYDAAGGSAFPGDATLGRAT